MNRILWLLKRLIGGVVIGAGVVIGSLFTLQQKGEIQLSSSEPGWTPKSGEPFQVLCEEGTAKAIPIAEPTIEVVQSRAIVDDSGFVRVVAELRSSGGDAEYVQPAAHLFSADGTFLFECTGSSIRRMEESQRTPTQIDCFGMDEEVAERYDHYKMAVR